MRIYILLVLNNTSTFYRILSVESNFRRKYNTKSLCVGMCDRVKKHLSFLNPLAITISARAT